MNVLVLGSGGREHAIITSFTNSKLVNKIYALPGNGGTSTIATNIQGDVDRKSTRLNSSHSQQSRMPSSA